MKNMKFGISVLEVGKTFGKMVVTDKTLESALKNLESIDNIHIEYMDLPASIAEKELMSPHIDFEKVAAAVQRVYREDDCIKIDFKWLDTLKGRLLREFDSFYCVRSILMCDKDIDKAIICKLIIRFAEEELNELNTVGFKP